MTTSFVALLRAVNVGGTGKLPMSELKAMCEKVGLKNVRTYIASGNVIFQSDKSEGQIKVSLEAELKAYAGKEVGVLVRSAAEIAAVLAANPFKKTPPNKTVAIFLDKSPSNDALDDVTGKGSEEILLGKREIYVHYGDGIAHSKLKIAKAKSGTARNINTVTKLSELANQLDSM